VVINGPVAIAGSIFILFSTNGIKVPSTVAKTITLIKAMLTVMLKFIELENAIL
jgi:hypothetical protein